jgi:hypothetical protein
MEQADFERFTFVNRDHNYDSPKSNPFELNRALGSDVPPHQRSSGLIQLT